MKYQVIDNILELNDFQIIKEILLKNSAQFPWYYVPCVADKQDSKHYYFAHRFYDFFAPNSEFFYLLNPLLKIIDPKALIRAKANFYPRTAVVEKHGFHKDLDYLHKGAVFYVNSNDGYTEFTNGEKVQSLENRILLFDSSELHRSTTCTDQQGRITININYF